MALRLNKNVASVVVAAHLSHLLRIFIFSPSNDQTIAKCLTHNSFEREPNMHRKRRSCPRRLLVKKWRARHTTC